MGAACGGQQSSVYNILTCRFGTYVILSAATCLALDWVTGPQKVARVPDQKQLELVREAAEQRRTEAQLQLLRRQEAASGRSTGMSLSRLSKVTRRTSHANELSSSVTGSVVSSAACSPMHPHAAAAAGGGGGRQLSAEGGAWTASIAGVHALVPADQWLKATGMPQQHATTAAACRDPLFAPQLTCRANQAYHATCILCSTGAWHACAWEFDAQGIGPGLIGP